MHNMSGNARNIFYFDHCIEIITKNTLFRKLWARLCGVFQNRHPKTFVVSVALGCVVSFETVTPEVTFVMHFLSTSAISPWVLV